MSARILIKRYTGDSRVDIICDATDESRLRDALDKFVKARIGDGLVFF